MEIGSEGCIYNYVVSAQKPTSVHHSAVGHFTAATDLNLVLAKSTRLEIHKLTPDGLQGVLDVPIYGRIAALKLFRPRGEPLDLLFLLTERYKFCVLAFDAEAGELVTRAAGDASDPVGRPAEAGMMAVIDPGCRMIGLHLYDGLLKVIPLDERGQLQEAFNVRLEELRVVDLAMLDPPAGSSGGGPTLAVLFEDTKEQRHVKTYTVSIRDKELGEGPWAQANLDPGSSLLVPVRGAAGAVVVGESYVAYLEGGTALRSAGLQPTLVKAYGSVDEAGGRYLLGDHMGNLLLLVLVREAGRVSSVRVEPLGRTSQASSLAYLDSGVVFVGSSFGDSQLIRLHSSPPNPEDPTGYVEVLDSMTNLGPIVDFCVVDLERQGQGQVVTCSGAGVDGSLRIVRNGIGVIEQAAVELPGIKGVWSLRSTYMDVHDTYLVLTFVGETRVLGINAEEELDEAEIAGFDAGAQTLYCGNTLADQFVQVTAAGVRLVDCTSGQLVAEWRPREGATVSVAAGSPTQVVLASGGGHLVYLELGEGAIREAGHAQLEAEIACLDVTPTGEGDEERGQAVAVGTWALGLHVFALPGLRHVTQEAVGGEVIPRSVLFARFEGVTCLLCGLGDGHLLSWRLEGEGLAERKKLALGTKPVTLRTFKSRGASHVFAASDRPTIIYSSSRKLLFSNLNENEVNFMASFNTASFPDSLAIAKEETLTIGNIDEIQKLHIRTVPLHEQPRRIAHQESSRSFAVVTTKATFVGGLPATDATDVVRLLDDQTFETLDRFVLGPNELACSLGSMSFANDAQVYYVVGTALAIPEEPEPTKGRVLVFSVLDGKLSLVSEKETRGAVYNVLPFQGSLLTGINSRVQLYKWVQQDNGAWQLVPEASHAGHVLALYIDSRGDFIIVGDLMKSLQLLMFKPEDGTLEVRARDFNANWMSAAAILDDDTYIGGENEYNLFVVRKNSDAATDEERVRLEVVGQYHLGEYVNRFRRGSLVMKLPDSELSHIPTLLYGTINGVIGVIASLPQQTYSFLESLQEAMRRVVKGVGGFDHSQWRAFSNLQRTEPARNFIDGDLIEQFLDLRRDDMESVVSEMGGSATLEEVARVVEELSRIH